VGGPEERREGTASTPESVREESDKRSDLLRDEKPSKVITEKSNESGNMSCRDSDKSAESCASVALRD